MTRVLRGWGALGALLLLVGCGAESVQGVEPPFEPPVSNENPLPPPDAGAPGGPDAPGEPDVPGEPDDPGEPDVPTPLTYPLACHPIYAEDLLPTFELEVSEASWALLRQEFQEDPGRETEFPATFRYAGEVYPDATIRLRGNHSKCGDKMQFAIAFNKVDREGRFRGLRRLNLDHGGCYHLEERLALSYLRDVGLPTACSNHARLVVNGAYYGLFSNIEHINKDFLKRQFPGAENDGNLWKSGHVLKTNEDTTPRHEIEAFWRLRTLAEVETYADLDEAVLEWAAEAVLPACDNYWLYGWNYYLYEHPRRGLLWVPTDLDCSWALLEDEVERDIFFPTPLQPPADLVLADPAWRQKYLAAVRHSVSRMDVAKLEARADRWWAQIAEAARTDPHAPYTEAQVLRFKDGLRKRRAWLERWVQQHAAP